MANKILISYLLTDFLLLLTGCLLLAFSITATSALDSSPTIETVARNLIIDRSPMAAGIANAVIIFIAFLTTIPALLMPTTRAWLRLKTYLVIISAFLSLITGLTLWFSTLSTRSSLLPDYTSLSASSQSFIQQKFNCCGYLSPTQPIFVRDEVCRSNLQAATMRGCVGPLSEYANGMLDIIFTAVFGAVGVDVLVCMATAVWVKDRNDAVRWREIDQKTGGF